MQQGTTQSFNCAINVTALKLLSYFRNYGYPQVFYGRVQVT